jgi:uncharacterized membrane protein
MSLSQPPAPLGPRRWVLPAILAFAALCYALLALTNHYLFRTFAFDLGIYNQALWDYAHGRVNVNSIMRFNNVLGDHFSPWLVLWIPFYWLFGSYALPVVQIAAAVLGGYGAYRLHRLRSGEQQLGAATALAGHFLSCWGILAALAFDYHDNMVAAMLLPWLFYLFEKDRRAASAALFGLLLLSKESVALWLVFVALGLAVLHWRQPRRRWLALALAALAAICFAVITKLIIPGFSNEIGYVYEQRYAAVGGSFGQIIHTALTRPLYVLGLLFRNHLGVADGDYVKLELHLMVLLSGGYALLRRPAYLLMLLPIYAQKMFSGEMMHWGLNYQFSIEFVPVMSAALSHWLLAAPTPRRAARLATAAALLALVATIVSLEVRRSPWHDKTLSQFYLPRHYRRDFAVGAVHEALQLIPADAAVSASVPLVPHLAARPYIFMYPYVGTANYLAILQADNPYPLTEAALARQVAQYRASAAWQVVYDQAPLLLLRRRTLLPTPTRRYFARRITGAADTTVADAGLPGMR